MKKIQSVLLLAAVLVSANLSADCSKEQKTRLIMNEVSQAEIDKICNPNKSSDQGNVIIINNNNNNNNNNQASNDNPYANNPSIAKSALEVRVGAIFGNGTATYVYNGSASSIEDETATVGYKVQVGMSTVKNNMYSYLFIGYQTTETLFGTSSVPTEGTAFLFGGESASGGESLKFVFGGEFGLGSELTPSGGEYDVFIAEPYIGLRYNMTKSLSLNAKVGYRAKVMSGEDNYSNTYEVYDFGIVSGVTLGFAFN